MTVLVDSDVLIEVLRNREQLISGKWDALSQSDALVLYSPISQVELWSGVRPKEEKALAALFGALQCVPIDSEIGRQAGKYLLEFGKSHGLQIGDALIAASASLRQASLWTRKRKHYPMRDVKIWDHQSDTSPTAPG